MRNDPEKTKDQRIRELEQRLRRVRKLEAVGRLAGGVAHDFNNVLQAIQGYTDLALSSLPEDHDAASKLKEVLKASDRAAGLTRQLLSFSQRETLPPRSLDLNRIVDDLVKLLRRLIGEDVQLYVFPATDLKPVHADPGQLEELLMHICLNARESMPDGGDLTLETKNVRASASGPGDGSEMETTDHVQLVVTHTGGRLAQERSAGPAGRPPASELHGEEAGLPTVYAIAEELGGTVDLDRGPGQGTAVRVRLPASAAPVMESDRRRAAPGPGGTETVLLAEDDELVRNLAQAVLGAAGYRLLVARDGEEALALVDKHLDEIDLVVADVIMPRKGGREVYDAIRSRGAKIPVLFSSGYSYPALEGKLPDGEGHLMQKPYSPRELLQTVREILDGC